MKRIVFISGTDTDVGKTYVSYLLAKDGVSRGKVLYIKPIQTGCEEFSDASEVKESGCDVKTIINLKLPASPHLAAKEEGENIDLLNLIFEIKKIINTTDYDFYLIEGAGGLMVPLNDKYFVSDMIPKLGIATVYLVTRPGLGTLNHTNLSLEHLYKLGVRKNQIVIVFNFYKDINKDSVIIQDNIKYFQKNYKTVVVEYKSKQLQKSYL